MKTRIRDRAWRDFVDWCWARGLRPLPAHPWAVAAYARWCHGRRRQTATIETAVKAIAIVHARRALNRPDASLIVRRTLVALARGDRPGRPSLFAPEDLFAPTAAPSGDEPAPSELPDARFRTLRVKPRLVARRRFGSLRP
jgi:hypothetical protein